MSNTPPDDRYRDRPVDGHDGNSDLVGLASSQGTGATPMPVYYDEETRGFFGARMNESTERLERLQDEEWDLDATESVGEGIERIGDELGWDSLSSFAEEHLQSDD